MAKMTQGDFKYLKGKIFSDKDYHSLEFLQRINPDLIDAYFEGDPDENYKDKENPQLRISLNKIFPSTTTILSQLYPINPKFVAVVRPGQNELDALITTNRMNYHFEQMGALKENQLAIISAWLYGFGATKQGWRAVYKKADKVNVDASNEATEPRKGIFGQLKQLISGTPQTEEEDNSEYIAEEGPFINYINNKRLYFDKDQLAGKGKFLTQHIPKTLFDIRQDGMYDVEEDFYNRFRRAKDEREVEVNLYEQYSWTKNGMYLFVMCDGYDKPLRFDKLPNYSEGFPIKVLRYNLQPNRVYEISNMKVAQQAQRAVDYILRLQKEKIEKWKDITVFSGEAFDADSKAKITRNVVDANLFTRSGISPIGAAQGISSNPIPQDLFNVQSILENNIREILSVSGARTGSVESKTLGQEQMIDAGNQLRSMGLQERIREFMVSQGKKLKQDMAQFDMETSVYVKGLNKVDPATGMKITDDQVDLSPRSMKDVIPKEMEFTTDITEFSRRDIAVVRKQLTDVIAMVMNPVVSQALMMEGKKVAVGELIKDTLKTFETLGNVDKYIEDIQQPSQNPLNSAQIPSAIPSSGSSQDMGKITPESIMAGARDTGGI